MGVTSPQARKEEEQTPPSLVKVLPTYSFVRKSKAKLLMLEGLENFLSKKDF